MSIMLNEIYEQPEIIPRLAAAEAETAASIAAEIKARDICFGIMAARGTSDHAAIYGKYLLEIRNGLPVALADPSVFTLYGARMRMDHAVVIGVSQSGQATDVAEYLQRSREAGALTVAVTNVPGSTLTGIADHTILCHAGEERAVAATKTYTATLGAMYLLSGTLAGDDAVVDNLTKCAEAMRAALDIEDFICHRSQRYRYMREGYVISRGVNYCTALEMALKMAETCYVGMKAHSAADFLHGPIAAVHEDAPCFLIAAPGPALRAMRDTARLLRERGAETVVISSDDEILSLAGTACRFGVDVDEELSPLVYVIPGQLFAQYLAVDRGYDPDRPRGLAKITLTR